MWCGVVWCGVVWCGGVGWGVVWCVVECVVTGGRNVDSWLGGEGNNIHSCNEVGGGYSLFLLGGSGDNISGSWQLFLPPVFSG